MNLFRVSFARPEVLFLLLLLLPLLFLVFRRLMHLRNLHLQLGSFSGRRTSKKRMILQAFFYAGAFALFLLAWAGPRGAVEITPARSSEGSRELIYLVDSSASMSIVDPGEFQTRLEKALALIEAQTVSFPGATRALVPFTTLPTTLVPKTRDTIYFRIALRGISINEPGVPGTDFSKLFTSLGSDPDKTYILLSDGGDTLLQEPGREQTLLQQARLLKGKWIVVGLGSEEPQEIPGLKQKSAQEKRFLQTLAKSLKGDYFDLSARDKVTLPQNAQAAPTLTYEEYFTFPLLLGLLFFLLGSFVRQEVAC